MRGISFSLTRLILLEALRARTIVLVLFILVVAALIAWFLGQIAITETNEIQIVSAASFLRLASVFVIITYIVFSHSREANDRGTDLLISLPISRSTYYISKILGYILLGWILATTTSLFLYMIGASNHLWLWFFSFGCELSIMVAVSLFFSITLSQQSLAILFIMGFYLLARSISIFQLLGEFAIEQTYQTKIISNVLEVISIALPRFDLFTQAGWLVSSSALYPVSAIMMQTLIYLFFIGGLSLLDLYRKCF